MFSTHNSSLETVPAPLRPILNYLNPQSETGGNPFTFTKPSESLVSFLENYQGHFHRYIDEETGEYDRCFGDPPYRAFSRKELLEISFAKFLSETGPYWSAKMGDFISVLEVEKHYRELVEDLETAETLGRPSLTNRDLLVEIHELFEAIENSYLFKHISDEEPDAFVPHFGLILSYLATVDTTLGTVVAKTKRYGLLEETGREELSKASVKDLQKFITGYTVGVFELAVKAGWTGTTSHLTYLKKISEDLIEEFHRIAGDEGNTLSTFMKLSLTGKNCKYVETFEKLMPLQKAGRLSHLTRAYCSVTMGELPEGFEEKNSTEGLAYSKQLELVLKDLAIRLFTLYQHAHLILEEANKQLEVVENRKKKISEEAGRELPEDELARVKVASMANRANEKLFIPCLENLESLNLAVKLLSGYKPE